LKDIYYSLILEVTKVYNASPLRIIKPTIESDDNGFVIRSGITNFPPPISES
jgi:hypothetical protein